MSRIAESDLAPNRVRPARENRNRRKTNRFQTTRISRRAFTTSVNGTQQLAETTIEEIKRLPGGRVQAVRTVSGRMRTGGSARYERDPGNDGSRRGYLSNHKDSAFTRSEQLARAEGTDHAGGKAQRWKSRSKSTERAYLPASMEPGMSSKRRVSRIMLTKTGAKNRRAGICPNDINIQLSPQSTGQITESRIQRAECACSRILRS